MTANIRVELPTSLCALANTNREVVIPLAAPATQRALLDALEANFPALRGTIRDHTTRQRRPFVRFFACGQDLSHLGLDQLLPLEVIDGRELFMVVGAIAGG
jgi:molybdopterin synthase sulfur carrier subunit